MFSYRLVSPQKFSISINSLNLPNESESVSCSVMSNSLWPPRTIAHQALCDPTDCSLPAFSVHRILQASRQLFPSPGIFPTQGSNTGLPHSGRFFTIWVTRQVLNLNEDIRPSLFWQIVADISKPDGKQQSNTQKGNNLTGILLLNVLYLQKSGWEGLDFFFRGLRVINQ